MQVWMAARGGKLWTDCYAPKARCGKDSQLLRPQQSRCKELTRRMDRWIAAGGLCGLCGLCVLGLGSRGMMSAPGLVWLGLEVADHKRAERWNGRPGQKRTSPGQPLDSIKHGPPGAAAPAFQGFPRCSKGPWIWSPGACWSVSSVSDRQAPKTVRYSQVARN